MSALREKMVEEMQLRGLASRTQASYLGAVRRMAQHLGKSPANVTEEELRRYFLYLVNEKKASRSTCTVALCALKFLFQHTLQRAWPTLETVRPPKEKRLPAVLSRPEVFRLLGCLQRPQFQTSLTTIYACGLRLQECLHIQVGDIDGDRKLLHIRQGKGGKDRYVPLPQPTLQLLRRHWRTHRHPLWLFPSPTLPGPDGQGQPVHPTSTQRAFRRALAESGIAKRASIHTLRHSWATHLVEAGVNIRLIQSWLGHRSLQSTTIYLHLTRQANLVASEAVERIMSDLPGI